MPERRILHRLLTVGMALCIAIFGQAPSESARAAGGLTVKIVTFDVIGYDSNTPSTGQKQFPVGARICNTSASDATGVVSTFAFGTSSAYITLIGSSTQANGTIGAGTCAEVYYTISVDTTATKSQLAGKTRTYTISASTANSSHTGASGTRTLYLEAVISQNSNQVYAITGQGGCNSDRSICDAIPSEVEVGGRYVFKLYAKTLSGGVQALESFITFPGEIFRIVSIRSTYTVPAGVIGIGPYVDACGFVEPYAPTAGNYEECPNGAQPGFTGTSGQVGGTIITTYTVDVIAAGAATLKALIYHFGGQWQYNSDFNAYTQSVTAKYPLTATVTGDGKVTSNSGGLNCGTGVSVCSILVSATTPATSITLTAAPSAGRTFTAWGGDCASAGFSLTCTVSMSQARSVTATFSGNSSYPLNVSVSGGGAINSGEVGTKTISSCKDGSGDCSETYTSGEIVTLTATPDSGYLFFGWGGACSGDSSTCSVAMSEARTVTAVFGAVSATTFPLTVSRVGPGSVTTSSGEISCGLSCSAEYAEDTSVTLTATPGSGETFSGWGGACSGTASTCTVIMSQSRFVSAAFSRKILTVTYTGQGGGSVTSSPSGIVCVKPASCSGTFNKDQVVILTVTPSAGSTLGGWGGTDGGSCNDSSSTCEVTLSSDRTVDVELLGEIALSVTKVGGGSSTVSTTDSNISCGNGCSSASHNYQEKAAVSLTRTVAAGYRFVGWSGSCSGSGETCSVTMSESKSITVQYATLRSLTSSVTQPTGAGHAISSSVGVDSYGGQSCSPVVAGCTDFDENTVVTLTRSAANSGYRFKAWLNDGSTCSASSTTCQVTLSEAKTVAAQYVALKDLTVTVVRPAGGTSSVSRSIGAGEYSASCGSDCQTYDADTQVTLSASAGDAEEFVGWTNNDDTALSGCSGTGSCTITLSESKTVKATFRALVITEARTLSVGKLAKSASTTAGSITSDAGLSCGNSCASSSRSLNKNTQITLTVSAGSDHRFIEWSGVTCQGLNTGASCTFTLTENLTINAKMYPIWALTRSITQPDGATHDLTVSLPEGATSGTSCGTSCTKYDESTVVTLTRAAAASGYRFKEWGGACSSVVASVTTCSVTMSEAKSVSATYVGIKRLTVDVSGGSHGVSSARKSGSTYAGAECTVDDKEHCADYDDDTVVTLTRDAAASGYRFKEWGGACSTEASTSRTCDVTMSVARSVTATFVAVKNLTRVIDDGGAGHTLTATVSITDFDDGEACGDTCKKYDQGTVVTLTREAPKAGYRFKSWLNDGSSCLAASTTCVVTVSDAKTVTAQYGQIYQVDINLNKNGSLTTNVNNWEAKKINCTTSAGVETGVGGGVCSLYYDKDDKVTIDVTPETGGAERTRFKEWENNAGATFTECANAVTIVERVKGKCEVTVGGATPVSAELSVIVPLFVEIARVSDGDGFVTTSNNWIDEKVAEACTDKPLTGTTNGAVGDPCVKDYDKNQNVTLVAQAKPGSVFVGWEDATNTIKPASFKLFGFSTGLTKINTITSNAIPGCTTASCVVTLDQAKYVRAVFEASPSGSGGSPGSGGGGSTAACSVNGTLPALGSDMPDLIPSASGASVTASMKRAGSAERPFGSVSDERFQRGVRKVAVGGSCATEVITRKGKLQFATSTYVGADSTSAFIWSEGTGWKRLASATGGSTSSVTLPVVKFDEIGHYVIAITNGTGAVGSEGMWGTRSALISVWITTPSFEVNFKPDRAKLSAKAKRILGSVMSEIALIPSEISVQVKGYINPFVRDYRRWQNVPLTVADLRADRIFRYLLDQGLRVPVLPESSERGRDKSKVPNRKARIVISWGTGT